MNPPSYSCTLDLNILIGQLLLQDISYRSTFLCRSSLLGHTSQPSTPTTTNQLSTATGIAFLHAIIFRSVLRSSLHPDQAWLAVSLDSRTSSKFNSLSAVWMPACLFRVCAHRLGPRIEFKWIILGAGHNVFSITYCIDTTPDNPDVERDDERSGGDGDS